LAQACANGFRSGLLLRRFRTVPPLPDNMKPIFCLICLVLTGLPMASAVGIVRNEPVQLVITANGPAVKMQSNALATNHEAVKEGNDLTMGNYAWMHETKQVESAFDAAFQQWGSAVRGAKFIAMSTGDLVADPAITVPKIILDKKNESCASCQCAFVNRASMPANCDIEANSRLMAVKWIPKTATVLEVGARYGSVSCTISRVLGNSGKQVSVDADERVWAALEHNRQNLYCNFHTAKGLLGTHDGKIMQNRYGTLASTSDTLGGAAKGVTVPHFTVDDLEKKYNLKFDTANFDCEGCFAPVSETFPEMFNKLKLMIVEVHDDKEAAAVAKLEANGWETIDRHSRQHVLKRTGRLISTPADFYESLKSRAAAVFYGSKQYNTSAQ